MIVLTVEDVIKTAARSQAFRHAKQDGLFWQAVSRVVDHYEDRGFVAQCLARQVTLLWWPPPRQLAAKVVSVPSIDNCTEPDRQFQLRLAQTYDCFFLSNSNFREIQSEESHPCYAWFKDYAPKLKIEYIFGVDGVFVPGRS
jgi:hypothetical protein